MRRSLPLCVVDAALVALAYYLAFWLRFDQSLSTHGNYRLLLTRTWPWVALGTALVLALSGVYRRRRDYGSQRNIAHLAWALVVATVLLVWIVALVHPVVRTLLVSSGGARIHAASVALGLPAAVVESYFLLALAFLIGVRRLARAVGDGLPGLRSSRDQPRGPALP